MTVKEYLLQYQSLSAERQNLIAERNLILADEALPKGMDYSADRVQSSPSDKMVDTIVRIQKRSKYIDRRISEIDKILEEIKNSINSIHTGTYKRLLFLRYVESKSWEKISMELGYWTEGSDSIYVRGKLHSRALYELYKELTKGYTKT